MLRTRYSLTADESGLSNKKTPAISVESNEVRYQCLQVDFQDAEARTVAVRRMEAERQRRKERIYKEKVEAATKEMEGKCCISSDTDNDHKNEMESFDTGLSGIGGVYIR